MTLRELYDIYLQYQHSRVLANELTSKHYNDQIDSLRRLMSFLGQGRRIESILSAELQKKTGVGRNLPLWPETIQALKEVPRLGRLVFYTAKGHPWIRTLHKTGVNGDSKYTTVNSITSRFSRLLRKAEMHAPKGTCFYTLRRTAATLAARSGDPFAVQRLLGHVNLEMATRYVQDVSEQTDRVIENSRKYVIQGKGAA